MKSLHQRGGSGGGGGVGGEEGGGGGGGLAMPTCFVYVGYCKCVIVLHLFSLC